MVPYYEKIIDLWEKGEVAKAAGLFEEYKKEGLLSQDEIQDLSKKLPDLSEQLLGLRENPEGLYNFYMALKKLKGWGDKTMSKELSIDEEIIRDIRRRRGPIKQKFVDKIIMEYFQELKLL